MALAKCKSPSVVEEVDGKRESVCLGVCENGGAVGEVVEVFV